VGSSVALGVWSGWTVEKRLVYLALGQIEHWEWLITGVLLFHLIELRWSRSRNENFCVVINHGLLHRVEANCFLKWSLRLATKEGGILVQLTLEVHWIVVGHLLAEEFIVVYLLLVSKHVLMSTAINTCLFTQVIDGSVGASAVHHMWAWKGKLRWVRILHWLHGLLMHLHVAPWDEHLLLAHSVHVSVWLK